jgi:crotonobetainyl-CoA:carnitine CoA-transferase CaiB-like acyl-CoA transferase
MSDNPQVLADGMIYELDHAVTGPQKVIGPIVTMSKTPTGPHRAAPALGQHTREVLAERGVDSAEVDRLLEEGVLYQM